MNSNTRYKHIVVGCGGLGSAALYSLAERSDGHVLGLEQFRLGHTNGGSQDHSRIIRHAYHSTDYGRLTRAAYDAWRAVEERARLTLLCITGGLDLAMPGEGAEATLEVYASTMTDSKVPFERLSWEDVSHRWPQWREIEGATALYQAECGIVDAARANATHIALARAKGATVIEETEVLRILASAGGVEVQTNKGSYFADSMVVAVGSWLTKLAHSVDVHIPLTIKREQVVYYATPNLAQFSPDRFPIWIAHAQSVLYGFPIYGEVATKVGEDVGGPTIDIEQRDFVPSESNLKKLEAFMRRHLPDALGPVRSVKTCLYDMPPDRNFIVDRLPGLSDIVVLNGAGHAFKFASLLGSIAADLLVDGSTKHDISPFRLDRPAITDPTFPPEFRLA